MRSIILAVALLLASPCAASAQDCRIVHGRMSLTDGTPGVRIWVVGTHRILGVVQQDLTYDQLPSNIRRAWAARNPKSAWDLFGDFTVCAVTGHRPGRMQMVRVQKAANLRVAKRSTS